jgi:hypothetical protein
MRDSHIRSAGLAVPLALTVLAFPPLVAAQSTGNGEAYVTQATREAAQAHAVRGTDPAHTPGVQVQERLFRNSPLAAGGAAAGPTAAAASAGGGNTAVIVQKGSGNAATLEQHGNGNFGEIVQKGSANTTHAVQEGNHNVLRVELAGARNEFNLVQRGDDNQYVRALRGSGLKETVVQQGVGLSVVQVGAISVPFSVQQIGRGMEIRIEHNGVTVP